MKKLFNFLIILTILETIWTYISQSEYRSYNFSQVDTSSSVFYSNWVLELLYVSNSSLYYFKNCESTVFGYFREGNISMFYSDSNYGSLGFNFNLVILKSTLNLTNDKDSLWVIFNHNQVKGMINLRYAIGNSTLQTLCGNDVYITKVSVIYVQYNALLYSDVYMTISSNFNPQSTVDWAISELYINKVSCAPKCLICNYETCLGCRNETNTYFENNRCNCNNTMNYYDLGGVNDIIKCKSNLNFKLDLYKQVITEDFSKKNIISKDWYWNNNSISPFYYKYNCQTSNLSVFGGYKTFADRDVINKYLSMNDPILFKYFRISNSLFYYQYQIDISLMFFNWNQTLSLNLIPFSTSPNIPIFPSNSSLPTPCSDNIMYTTFKSNFSFLIDMPNLINITLLGPVSQNRINNTFGISSFNLSISSCYSTCSNCSSPSYNGCLNCTDINAVISNGECVCKSGYDRDPFDSESMCVAINQLSIVNTGNMTENGSLINYNISKSYPYCNNTYIVGGNITNDGYPFNSKLEFIIYESQFSSFYMKKFIVEIITIEDNSLLIPFNLFYKGNVVKPIKQLIKRDCISFKRYYLEIYINDFQDYSEFVITNIYNNFFGVVRMDVYYYNCNPNCQSCIGPRPYHCLGCIDGMRLNLKNKNLSTFLDNSTSTYSCLCDDSFYQLNSNYTLMNCSQNPKINYFKMDLNMYQFDSELWSDQNGPYPSINNYQPINCFSTNILGKYNVKNMAYLTKTININTPFTQIDFTFDLYQFSVQTPVLVQIYLDNVYVHGYYYNSYNAAESFYCNSSFIYKKNIAFSYFLTDYFYMISTTVPLMKIVFNPDTPCLQKKICGWGIANFTMNVTLPTPITSGNIACLYRPFSTNYCTAASTDASCIPGFYAIKNANSESSCTNCQANCLICSSSTKCTQCFPGYDLNSNICLPIVLVPSSTQSVITRIDLGIYNMNKPYLFNGFGLNFWVKLVDNLIIENPLIQLDTYLLNYYSNSTSINIRRISNSSLYGQAAFFPLIYEYNLSLANKANYESQWTSISFSAKPTFNNTKFILQIGVGNEVIGQLEDYPVFTPTFIQMFSWFSKKNYRNIQYWDKLISIYSLIQFNYINDFQITPLELPVYYKLTEGSFYNLGSAGTQIFVSYPGFISYVTDTTWLPNCTESSYYNLQMAQCVSCSSTCNHCFGSSDSNCSDCSIGYYLDYRNKSCVTSCSNSFPDLKYSGLNYCYSSCSSECSACDSSGCTKCIQGFFLYNGTCMNKCNDKMISQVPILCSIYPGNCIPNINITNKQYVFLLNKTNLNFKVNVTNCNIPYKIIWNYTLLGLISIQDDNKTLFIDGGTIFTPGNRQINVMLLDNNNNVLAYDSVVTNFISTTLNGGIVLVNYKNQIFNISANLYDSYVSPLRGRLIYKWKCPKWLSKSACNIRVIGSVLSFNISSIDTIRFKYGVPNDISVSISSNNIQIGSLLGFIIIHNDFDIMKYLNFNIISSSQFIYDHSAIFEIYFSTPFDPNLFQYLSIKWTVNLKYIPLNGDILPKFIFIPISYGNYTVTCLITYLKGFPQEYTTISTFNFTLMYPPYDGFFYVTHSQSISLRDSIMLINENWISSQGNSPDTFKYYYSFLNDFGEFSRINNLPLSETYNTSTIPPTSLINVQVLDNTSFSYYNVSVNISSQITKNDIKINDLLENMVYYTLQMLESYAINLKLINMTNIYLSDYYDISFAIMVMLNKTVFNNSISSYQFRNTSPVDRRCLQQSTLNSEDPGVLLFNNINKISNILEAISYRNVYYPKLINLITNVTNNLFYLSLSLNYTSIFSTLESNNLMRAYDNIISQLNDTDTFSNTDILENFELIKSYLGTNLDIGQEKVYQMKNFQFNAVNIQAFKIVKDYIFSVNNKQNVNRSVTTFPNPSLYDLNHNSSSLYSTQYDQCIIPLKTIKLINKSNIIVEIAHYNKDLTGIINSTVKSIVSTSFYIQFILFDQNNITQPKINTDSQAAIINFTLPKTFASLGYKLLLNATCVNIDVITGIADGSICNTWFDYTYNIIQCECDTAGFFTVVTSTNFVNTRIWGQFHKTQENLFTSWGFGTFTFLTGSLVVSIIWAYLQDRKALYDKIIALKENRGYSVYRDKIKGGLFDFTEITFGNLFREMYKKTHEMLSIHFFKDTYFLRAHRVIILFLRVYLVIYLAYLNHSEIPSLELQNKVKIRDISIKPNRYKIFEILNNLGVAFINAFKYSIPASFVLTFFPRFSEYFFRYNEEVLKMDDMKRYSIMLIDKYSPFIFIQNKMIQDETYKKINEAQINHFNFPKADPLIDPKTDRSYMTNLPLKDKSLTINVNLDHTRNPGGSDDIIERKKKFRAYFNFMIMIQSMIEEVLNDNFQSDCHSKLPPELAPIYMQRLEGQTEEFGKGKEKRIKDLKRRIMILENKKQMRKTNKNDLFKDDDFLMDNADLFMNDRQAVDVHQLDAVYEHVIENMNQIKKQEIKNMIEEEEVKNPQNNEEEKVEIEDTIKVYAFIPHYVLKHPKKLIYLVVVVFFLLLLLFCAAIEFSLMMVRIRNLSGFNMAISWIINFLFTLLNCYLISGPIMTAIKVSLIMKYRYYRRRNFEVSIRYFLSFIFITDMDLCLYKELKECIKNYKEEEKLKEDENDDRDKKDEDIKKLTHFHNDEKSQYSKIKKGTENIFRTAKEEINKVNEEKGIKKSLNDERNLSLNPKENIKEERKI